MTDFLYYNIARKDVHAQPCLSECFDFLSNGDKLAGEIDLMMNGPISNTSRGTKNSREHILSITSKSEVM